MIKGTMGPWAGWAVMGAGLWVMAGCGGLRLAPGEAQKQNAWLHHRTVQTAAVKAQQEAVSPVLRELTGRAAEQSEAIVAYYGLPNELPKAGSVEEILSGSNATITENARQEAGQRPDGWAVADQVLELGIGIAGLVGGVFGTRVVTSLQTARQKSQALREIVQGNQLFKQEHPEVGDDFKKAQALQSEPTRCLVAALK